MENVVPYKLVLDLVSKNFTSPVKYYYNIYNKHLFVLKENLHNESVLAPSYNDVVNWFKETHNMDIEPSIESIEKAIKKI